MVAIGKIKACIAARNLRLYGERDVPVDENEISALARSKAPYMYQMFIGTANQDAGAALDSKLYLLRKAIEAKLTDEIYVASLSSQTLVYKGMLRAKEVSAFYTDLQDERFVSALALVHSRYSTNTFPSWERAHPNRMIVHNGEINTIRGNMSWFNAKAKRLDGGKLPQIIDPEGSDSAIFDNVLEFLTYHGFSLPHAVMMMVPELGKVTVNYPNIFAISMNLPAEQWNRGMGRWHLVSAMANKSEPFWIATVCVPHVTISLMTTRSYSHRRSVLPI
ncbi:glutamate synthase [NADPH] large chain [Sporolactobacillus inulinus]|uniref:Glutamate synthase [NADPH] large chain n=1 Tax=Sporolactobacillus inulinus TaxID=2078 RepID=A0A4Y1ZF27_9BACL|nr:glutamate synthase [NADPH] large chain [Sporolactobacillus inulinus]